MITRLIKSIGLLVLVVCMASGCAHNTELGSKRVDSSDPIESTNRAFFNFNQKLDKWILKPVASTYADIIPASARTRVTYFFENIGYLNTIFNSFLQGKVEEGVQGSLRFLYNSSFGIGGLFDVATVWGLPNKKKDLGQTLAYWGINQGAYLDLPLFGSNTLRNLPNFITKSLLNPFFYASNTVFFPVKTLTLINRRANFIAASDMRDEMAIDAYTFTREAYLQKRKIMIDENKKSSNEYEFFDDTLFDALDDE